MSVDPLPPSSFHSASHGLLHTPGPGTFKSDHIEGLPSHSIDLNFYSKDYISVRYRNTLNFWFYYEHKKIHWEKLSKFIRAIKWMHLRLPSVNPLKIDGQSQHMCPFQFILILEWFEFSALFCSPISSSLICRQNTQHHLWWHLQWNLREQCGRRGRNYVRDARWGRKLWSAGLWPWHGCC